LAEDSKKRYQRFRGLTERLAQLAGTLSGRARGGGGGGGGGGSRCCAIGESGWGAEWTGRNPGWGRGGGCC